jgi:hypothetical protein
MIRLLLAVWIAVIVVVLCYSGRWWGLVFVVPLVVVLCYSGRWWGLVFVVPLVLDLYLLRRILVADSSW